MSTLSVIYPNLWAQNPNHVGDNFHQCLIVIKVIYCNLYKAKKNGVWGWNLTLNGPSLR
jgi:hypothetical protein